MIVPSIDLMDGRAVQLVGGETKVIDAGDPRPLAERFGRVGEVAVIDLDAALGRGSNAGVIRELLALAPCRVGGGIRDAATARAWLDAGATKVILGTAARPEVLGALPRERVIAALDARHGDVVVDGWRTATGASIEARMDELRAYVGGFLVTFVEREGRMVGLPEDRIAALVDRAGDTALTVAGGVRTAGDIAIADRLGADAQVGMALYSGAIDLADGFCAPLRSDRPDGLWPTVVCDEAGAALGLVYSNRASIGAALDSGRGTYWSRSRNALWTKGATSGAEQTLVRLDVDCDRDALRATVRQAAPGFCHRATATCFGAGTRTGLAELERIVTARTVDPPAGSYTARLVGDSALLAAKLAEEAAELGEATARDDVVWETADVLFFALVALVRGGGTLADVERELTRRHAVVTRRSAAEETPV